MALFKVAHESDFKTIAIAIFAVFSAYKYFNARAQRAKLDAIPTLGPNGIFASYITVWKYMFHGCELIEEGCQQYPSAAFKIPTLFGWAVIVNGRQMYEDLKRAPEESLSVLEAFEEVGGLGRRIWTPPWQKQTNNLEKLLQFKYTLSPVIHQNPYHIDVTRGALTRNIGARFDDVRDELKTAFNHYIPPQEGGYHIWYIPRGNWWLNLLPEWVEVPEVIKTIQNIVVRTSNRFFVGLPLCQTLFFAVYQLSDLTFACFRP
ncbi:hypothetical protein PQX77_005582 [Marasmius sp. AFHP31]|nr:hypothetical protein PQX77_005582 [Marasmius sp. AFHP31]